MDGKQTKETTQPTESKDPNIDYEKKFCSCCNVSFHLLSDIKRHIKTNKHVKKSINDEPTKCKFCDYETANKSNMTRHVKTSHSKTKHEIETKMISVGTTTIPENVLKQYFTFTESVNTTYAALMGKKHRIKSLKNRHYSNDANEVKEAIKEYNEYVKHYNNNVKMLKTLETTYPQIIMAIKPSVNKDTDEVEEEDNDDSEEKQKEAQIRANKLIDLEDLKDDLEDLYNKLRDRDFKDLKAHKEKIRNKENEIKELMREIYK